MKPDAFTDQIEKEVDLSKMLLFNNPILDMWRVSFVANAFVFPTYKEMETEHDLTRPEFVTMICLGNVETIAAQDIVGATSLPKNSVSRAVKRLEKKNIISRRFDTSDKRRSLLSLTEEGRKLYDEVLPKVVERSETVLSPLTKTERGIISSLMLKVSLAQIERTKT